MSDCSHADALRVGSAFCGVCGAAMPQPVASGPASIPPPPPASVGMGYPSAPGLAPARVDTSPAMWAHLGCLLVYLGGLVFTVGVLALFVWVPPLLILNGQGRQSRFVRAHAAESLNFQITQLIASFAGAVVAVALVFGAAAANPTAGLVAVIFVVVGGIAWLLFYLIVMGIASSRAARGDLYRYPLTVHFIK